jgi:glucosamine 6-phosphate synthetase-like amidotransferase/phosphosugar isomerase protein
LTGIILGEKRRTRKELDELSDTFVKLLLGSEHRGPHATGAAWVKKDSTMQVAKEPLPARSFIFSNGFIDWVNGVDNQVTCLMGHTRWPTMGTVKHPGNNHPLVATGSSSGILQPDTSIILCHNGVVHQPEMLATRWKLPRHAQVDSEILLQLAVLTSKPSGLDVDRYLHLLSQVPGRMALTINDTREPHKVLLVRGTMPLTLWLHRQRRLLIYASEEATIMQELGTATGWVPVPISMGEACLIDTENLNDIHWWNWKPLVWERKRCL